MMLMQVNVCTVFGVLGFVGSMGRRVSFTFIPISSFLNFIR